MLPPYSQLQALLTDDRAALRSFGMDWWMNTVAECG
jgi:hypothetical protein